MRSPELQAALDEVDARIAPLTLAEWQQQHPGEHLDINWNDIVSCVYCGLCKPRVGYSKPCKGTARISLR